MSYRAHVAEQNGLAQDQFIGFASDLDKCFCTLSGEVGETNYLLFVGHAFPVQCDWLVHFYWVDCNLDCC